MWIAVLIGLGVLLASSSAAAPTPVVFGKPEPLPVRLDCSQIPHLSGLMAARLLPGAKDHYNRGTMEKLKQGWESVVADWVFWTLKRQAGFDAPQVPALPWSEMLDRLGDPSWAWTYDGPTGSVSRRTLGNPWGPLGATGSYSDWAEVDCLAELRQGAQTAVRQWYTANGL